MCRSELYPAEEFCDSHASSCTITKHSYRRLITTASRSLRAWSPCVECMHIHEQHHLGAATESECNGCGD